MLLALVQLALFGTTVLAVPQTNPSNFPVNYTEWTSSSNCVKVGGDDSNNFPIGACGTFVVPAQSIKLEAHPATIGAACSVVFWSGADCTGDKSTEVDLTGGQDSPCIVPPFIVDISPPPPALSALVECSG